MVQAWLFDLHNSTSSQRRPGLFILSELQRRIADCSAREASGAQPPPVPSPPPAEPLGFSVLALPERDECPLLVANATVVAVNDGPPSLAATLAAAAGAAATTAAASAARLHLGGSAAAASDPMHRRRPRHSTRGPARGT